METNISVIERQVCSVVRKGGLDFGYVASNNRQNKILGRKNCILSLSLVFRNSLTMQIPRKTCFLYLEVVVWWYWSDVDARGHGVDALPVPSLSHNQQIHLPGVDWVEKIYTTRQWQAMCKVGISCVFLVFHFSYLLFFFLFM